MKYLGGIWPSHLIFIKPLNLGLRRTLHGNYTYVLDFGESIVKLYQITAAVFDRNPNQKCTLLN
jgi:hypothetical protein